MEIEKGKDPCRTCGREIYWNADRGVTPRRPMDQSGNPHRCQKREEGFAKPVPPDKKEPVKVVEGKAPAAPAKEMTVAPPAAIAVTAAGMSREQIDLIKRTICKGATDDELRLFLHSASSLGLDPILHEIHAVQRWDSRERAFVMSIQVGIDGFRKISARSGKYKGRVGPQWCGPDGEWRDVWLEDEPPVAARCGILNSDFLQEDGTILPIWGIARYRAYAQHTKDGDLTSMWKKFGPEMLAKCAEAAAHRAAGLVGGGVYAPEEMDQATLAITREDVIKEVPLPTRDPVKPLPPPATPPVKDAVVVKGPSAREGDVVVEFNPEPPKEEVRVVEGPSPAVLRQKAVAKLMPWARQNSVTDKQVQKWFHARFRVDSTTKLTAAQVEEGQAELMTAKERGELMRAIEALAAGRLSFADDGGMIIEPAAELVRDEEKF